MSIRNLRSKLEPDPSRPTHILTEAGLGYRLRAERLTFQRLGMSIARLSGERGWRRPSCNGYGAATIVATSCAARSTSDVSRSSPSTLAFPFTLCGLAFTTDSGAPTR